MDKGGCSPDRIKGPALKRQPAHIRPDQRQAAAEPPRGVQQRLGEVQPNCPIPHMPEPASILSGAATQVQHGSTGPDPSEKVAEQPRTARRAPVPVPHIVRRVLFIRADSAGRDIVFLEPCRPGSAGGGVFR
jgi:hypothetical protein